MESPIRSKELGDMPNSVPEIPIAQTSPKSDRLSCEVILGILPSFRRKPMNTKVEYNFFTHNIDSEFALLGVRTWEI
jgi:hypothetical protein